MSRFSPRLILAVLLGAVLVGGPATAIHPVNATSLLTTLDAAELVNPGFEDGDTAGIPTGWTYRAVRGDATLTVDDQEKRSGQYSLQLNGAVANTAAILTQEVALPDGSSGPVADAYSLRVWQKADQVSSPRHGASARITFRNSANQVIGTMHEAAGYKGTSPWRLIETIVNVPAGATEMLVELVLLDATGDIWFDDLELTGLNGDRAYPLNAGFEDGGSDTGVPTSWSYRSVRGQPSVSVDDQVFRSGAGSLKLSGVTQDSAAIVSQRIAVPSSSAAAHQYVLRVWQKAEGLTTIRSGAVVRLGFRDANNQVLEDQIEIAGVVGTSDWQLLEAIVAVPYGTEAFVVDLVLQDGLGEIWFDDLELEPLSLLRNPSFEHSSTSEVDEWSASVVNGQGVVERVGDDYFSGVQNPHDVHSVLLRGDSSDAQLSMSQTIDLPEALADGYAITFQYKTVDVVPGQGTSNGARITVRHWDEFDVEVGPGIHQPLSASTQEWMTGNLRLTPPIGTTRLTVSLELWNATGTLRGDRFGIVPASIAPTEAVHFGGLGSLYRSGQPTLSWRAVEGAQSYAIEYSQDPTFASGVTLVDEVQSTTLTPALELDDGDWYARGTTTDLVGATTAYGPTHMFTVRRLEAYPDAISPNDDGANDTTLFDYRLQTASEVTLEIVDSNDVRVRLLLDDVLRAAGPHQTYWDTLDDLGVQVPDGEYEARLTVAVSNQVLSSAKSLTIDSQEAQGFRGLENDDDWSSFEHDFIDKSAQLAYDYYDSGSGRYTFVGASNSLWPVQSAGYSFVMAYAYATPGTAYYQDPGALERAIGSFVAVMNHEVPGTGSWARARGLDQNQDRFALAPMAEAYMLIGDYIDDPLLDQQILDYLERAAQYQVVTYPTSTTSYGMYPNVDQSYAFVLAAVGTILDDHNIANSFLAEAAAMVELGEDEIFPNGGLSYISGANPVGSYQGLLGYWGRYYELTGDENAADAIRATEDYYPLAYEVDGVTEHGSAPELKAQWAALSMPMGATTVAYYTGDGRNLMVANSMRERISRTLPNGLASMSQVYHLTLSRNLDTSNIVPVKLTDQGVVADADIDGYRGRWGTFATSITASKNQPTRATAVVNTIGDPFSINAGGLGWAYFESRTGDEVHDRPRDWGYILPPRETSVVDTARQEGIVVEHIGVGNDIGVQHLRFTPVPSFGWEHKADLSPDWDWSVGETWVMVDGRLIGMHSMRVKESAVVVETGEHHLARSRLVFGPAADGTLNTTVVGNELFGAYNALGFYLDMGDTLGWSFNPDLPADGEPGSSAVGAPYRAPQHVTIEKDAGTSGQVSWGPYAAGNAEDSMSYNAIFFPLDDHATAQDWAASADNNVVFLETIPGLRGALIEGAGGQQFLVAVNHSKDPIVTSLDVPVGEGIWTVERFLESDVAVPLGDFTSSAGNVSVDVVLDPDSVVVYRLTDAEAPSEPSEVDQQTGSHEADQDEGTWWSRLWPSLFSWWQ